MTSKAKKWKNHTARSKSKSALAPADCVQMIGPANIEAQNREDAHNDEQDGEQIRGVLGRRLTAAIVADGEVNPAEMT
ncbi:MAG: hypothetical protein ACLTSX_08410 [Collinsella sp.]